MVLRRRRRNEPHSAVVWESGPAHARDGGISVSGIRNVPHDHHFAVSNSGSAKAVGPGAIAVSGILINQYPLPPTNHEIRTTLPRKSQFFTGRRDEMAVLESVVQIGTRNGNPRATRGGVVSIDGMPGVGKTTLALQAAHQVDAGLYSQKLYLNLRGHTAEEEPLSPFDALGILLTQLGMDSRYLPESLEDRSAHWRDRTSGKDLLLVLDNAAGSKQVIPLLPSEEKALVLITSRSYLGDLHQVTHRITLEPLAKDEARDLFRKLAPRANKDVDGALDVVTIDTAGRHPLAIVLLARVYADHPTWSIRTLAAKTRDRMMNVNAEDQTLRAVFDLSFDSLTTPQRRLFVLLGSYPGRDIDDYAAGALCAVDREKAQGLLEDLYTARLLTEGSPGRYWMHDLIHDYVRLKASGLSKDAQTEAVERVLSYYAAAAIQAPNHLSRYSRPISTVSHMQTPWEIPVHDSPSIALEWVRDELNNISACLGEAVSLEKHDVVVALASSVEGVLRRDGLGVEAKAWHQSAINSAIQMGDELAQAGALIDFGATQLLIDDYPSGAESFKQALALYRQNDESVGQANTHSELGVQRWMAGEYKKSIRHSLLAAGVYTILGDIKGQAYALNQLGVALQLNSDFATATWALKKAKMLYELTGEKLGLANTLTNLGAVSRETSAYRQALEEQEQARVLYIEVGNHLGQGNTLKESGITLRLCGDYPGAIRNLEQALAMHRRIGHRLGQANALKNMGAAVGLNGDLEKAKVYLDKARCIYEKIGNKSGIEDTQKFYGALALWVEDYPRAELLLDSAENMFSAAKNESSLVEVLNYRGRARLRGGRTREAREDYERARAIAAGIGNQHSEALARFGLTQCDLARQELSKSQLVESRTELEEILILLKTIGVAEVPEVELEITQISMSIN